jgi:hypothetical protein
LNPQTKTDDRGKRQQATGKIVHFVIPSEARNLSTVLAYENKERFLASLGMTKWWEIFFATP